VVDFPDASSLECLLFHAGAIPGSCPHRAANQEHARRTLLSRPYACDLDPLKRIQDVRVEVWAGNPAANRAFSPKEQQPQPGDGPHRTYPLTVAKDVATGDVLLPKLQPGQVAWVQPVAALAKGGSMWGAPAKQFLTVGEYPGAKRHAFSGDSPGLEFGGKGRGSNTLTGAFVVWELAVKDNKVVKLAIDFE
jgi:hypothetical protein